MGRFRYRRRRMHPAVIAAGAGLMLVAAAHSHAGTAAPAAHAAAAPSHAASVAVAFARAQIGKPYQWGATGQGAFDCSGLVQAAWSAAGVSIARTSQNQWATERHIPASQAAAGDLVFYPGADGTWTAPGHVAMVSGPGQMIEAYATGYPIRETLIRSGAVGFTDPEPS